MQLLTESGFFRFSNLTVNFSIYDKKIMTTFAFLKKIKKWTLYYLRENLNRKFCVYEENQIVNSDRKICTDKNGESFHHSIPNPNAYIIITDRSAEKGSKSALTPSPPRNLKTTTSSVHNNTWFPKCLNWWAVPPSILSINVLYALSCYCYYHFSLPFYPCQYFVL